MTAGGDEHLILKWGTLKGWKFNEGSPAYKAAEKYFAGGVSMSAMAQRDTDEQKAALCEMIDALDGEIWNDWEGEVMSPEAAKKYVMEYGR